MARPVILVVDDDPGVRESFRLILEDHYDVVDVPDGPSALDVVRASPMDLVLLDILMPDMSGFEVYQRLNERADSAPVPVIFLSALDDSADKIAGLGLGAVDYVTKPIQPEEVRARVDNHLTRLHLQRELRRNRDLLDRAQAQRLVLEHHQLLVARTGAAAREEHAVSRHSTRVLTCSRAASASAPGIPRRSAAPRRAAR